MSEAASNADAAATAVSTEDANDAQQSTDEKQDTARPASANATNEQQAEAAGESQPTEAGEETAAAGDETSRPAEEEGDDEAAETKTQEEEGEVSDAEEAGDAEQQQTETDAAALAGDAEDAAVPAAEADETEAELLRYNELVKAAAQQQEELLSSNQDGGQQSEGAAAADSASVQPLTITADSGDVSAAVASQQQTASASFSSLSPQASASSPHSLPAPDEDDAFDTDALPASSSSPSWSELEAAKAECEQLLQLNRQRQKQIAHILEAERRQQQQQQPHPSASSDPSEPASDSSASLVKTDYIRLLTQLQGVWEDIQAKQARAEQTVSVLLSKLAEQDGQGMELSTALNAFVHSIAESAVDSHGNRLSLKQLDRLTAQEQELSRRLAEVRLVYLSQQSNIDSLTADIRQREELSEGLHLIDFEQLKIENATLHEKIEERNDEIFKLKKKKAAAIEILTHVREKLWWLGEENAGLTQQLSAESDGILQLRQSMQSWKQRRERLRKENETLRVKQGFVGSDRLVADYEQRKADISRLSAELSEKQAEYNRLRQQRQSLA